mgnify:CR=1 FL=1
MLASRVHRLSPMVERFAEALGEQRFGDFRFYMYVEIGNELL